MKEKEGGKLTGCTFSFHSVESRFIEEHQRGKREFVLENWKSTNNIKIAPPLLLKSTDVSPHSKKKRSVDEWWKEGWGEEGVLKNERWNHRSSLCDASVRVSLHQTQTHTTWKASSHHRSSLHQQLYQQPAAALWLTWISALFLSLCFSSVHFPADLRHWAQRKWQGSEYFPAWGESLLSKTSAKSQHAVASFIKRLWCARTHTWST